MGTIAYRWKLLQVGLLLMAAVLAAGVSCRRASPQPETIPSAAVEVQSSADVSASARSAPSARAPRRAPAKGLWWRVKAARATVYLFGSIHVARADLYPLDPRIDQAFSSADTLVLEIDLTRVNLVAAAMKMGQRGKYPAGDSLERHVSAKTLEKLERHAPGGLLSASTLRQFRPWFVATTLLTAELEKLGYQPAHGLDQHFANQAKGKKEVAALETVEDQIEVFADMPEKTQVLMLEQTLDDLDQLDSTMTEVLEAWRRGDPKPLDEGMLAPLRTPELEPVFARLFEKRNRDWEQAVVDYLRSDKTYFVVVGAAHLVGKDSLVDLLERRDYRVTEQWRGGT